MNKFLINFHSRAKHFPVLPCYFMKREDSMEKHWILKLTWNFGGSPIDTASNFLKMASAGIDVFFMKMTLMQSEEYNWLLDMINKRWRNDCKRFQGSFKKRSQTILIWNQIFTNGPSKIFGRQPLRSLKWYGLLKQNIPFFKGCLPQILLVHSWIFCPMCYRLHSYNITTT